MPRARPCARPSKPRRRTTSYAGECTFHHAFTWHATPPNTVGGRRRALVTRFMAEGTRYRPAAGTRPVAVSHVDPMANDEWYPIVWPPAGAWTDELR